MINVWPNSFEIKVLCSSWFIFFFRYRKISVRANSSLSSCHNKLKFFQRSGAQNAESHDKIYARGHYIGDSFLLFSNWTNNDKKQQHGENQCMFVVTIFSWCAVSRALSWRNVVVQVFDRQFRAKAERGQQHWMLSYGAYFKNILSSTHGFYESNQRIVTMRRSL